MTFAELILVVRLVMLAPQFVYWFLLRDESRDDVVWDACVHPGTGPEPHYRQGSIL